MSERAPVVVFGSSGHAKVVIDLVECAGVYAIAGLLDDRRAVGDETLGHRVLGGMKDLVALVEAHALKGIVIAVGDNHARSQIAERIARDVPGLTFVTAIHPSANVARDVTIGAGSVVMAGATLNPGSRIGLHCIVNTGASLDHDSVMEDFSSLAPRAATGGGCTIGRGAAVGIGAVLRQGVRVGADSVVGAGSTVLESIADRRLAWGTPARVIRAREPGEPYL